MVNRGLLSISVLLLVPLLLFSGCSLVGLRTPPTLRERIAAAADSVLLPLEDIGASLGVEVRTISGDPVYAHDPSRLLIPASVQKLALAADALSNLPRGFRCQTRILATGPLDSIGILRGDLLVIGGWDPSLSGDRPYAVEESSRLEKWADTLHSAGLRVIDGDLVMIGRLRRPGGWEHGDLGERYAPVVSQLCWNDGLSVIDRRPVEDPRLLFAEQFHCALAGKGIEVNGEVKTDTLLRHVPFEHGIDITHHSAPLDSLLKMMLAVSSNHWAEMINAAVEEYRREIAEYSPGWLETLGEMGIDTSGGGVADACGLARRNNITAQMITGLLLEANERWGGRWLGLLPAPGDRWSTVEFRLTEYRSRLRVKTGMMSRIQSLAGYIMAGDRPYLAFCLVINNAPMSSLELGRVVDGFTALMVEALDRSMQEENTHVFALQP